MRITCRLKIHVLELLDTSLAVLRRALLWLAHVICQLAEAVSKKFMRPGSMGSSSLFGTIVNSCLIYGEYHIKSFYWYLRCAFFDLVDSFFTNINAYQRISIHARIPRQLVGIWGVCFQPPWGPKNLPSHWGVVNISAAALGAGALSLPRAMPLGHVSSIWCFQMLKKMEWIMSESWKGWAKLCNVDMISASESIAPRNQEQHLRWSMLLFEICTVKSAHAFDFDVLPTLHLCNCKLGTTPAFFGGRCNLSVQQSDR